MNVTVRIVIAAMLLFTSACASIPFGTMLRLSSYDGSDLANADPGAIRAAFQVPLDVAIRPGSATLTASLGPRDAPPDFTAHAKLALEEQGVRVITPLPPAKSGFHWFVFALDETGIAEFRRFQRELMARQASDEALGGSFSAHAHFEGIEHYDTLPMSVWLKLAVDDDWFALAKDAELPVHKDGS